jgi:hypothetical protein
LIGRIVTPIYGPMRRESQNRSIGVAPGANG